MYLHKDDKELDNNADETTDSYKKMSRLIEQIKKRMPVPSHMVANFMQMMCSHQPCFCI